MIDEHLFIYDEKPKRVFCEAENCLPCRMRGYLFAAAFENTRPSLAAQLIVLSELMTENPNVQDYCVERLRKMQFVMSQVVYAIEVGVAKFRKILDRETAQRYNDTLCDRLYKVEGLEDLNYDAMFGDCVCVTIDADHDNEEKHQEIRDVIEKYAKGE